MLNCGLIRTVLNVVLVVQNVISLRCSESVYTHENFCTIESYNSSIPSGVQLDSIYDRTEITHLRFRKSMINLLSGDLLLKFPNLKILDVSNCDVEEIRGFLLFEIQHLNVSNNQLERLNEFTFGPAMSLTIIDLSYNHIAHIDRLAFIRVPKIDIIDLSHNRIQSLPDNFILTCNELNLSFNNINNATFSDNTIIRRVNFNNNKLFHLHVNQYLENLTITHNMITSFDFFTITNNGLTALDLSFNPLTYNDSSIKKVFLSLTNLRVLFLKSTNLNEMKFSLLSELFDLFRELETIDISENNWQCTDLIKIVSNLKQLDIEVLTPKGSSLSKTDITVNNIRCHTNTMVYNTICEMEQQYHLSPIINRNLLYVAIAAVIIIFILLLLIMELCTKRSKVRRVVVNQSQTGNTVMENDISINPNYDLNNYHQYEMVVYSDVEHYNKLQWE